MGTAVHRLGPYAGIVLAALALAPVLFRAGRIGLFILAISAIPDDFHEVM